jgi:hypothetical protein
MLDGLVPPVGARRVPLLDVVGVVEVGGLVEDLLVPGAEYEIRDLVPNVPLARRPDDDGWLCLFRSSSTFRADASFFRCSSSSLRSASCCFSKASFSMSAISLLAPCHDGSRISRWLCSV